jgi:hypothetical protein
MVIWTHFARSESGSQIIKGLQRVGYQPIDKINGFHVAGHAMWPSTDGNLNDGELERAKLWGMELAKMIS